jgi:hypothetical protein
MANETLVRNLTPDFQAAVESGAYYTVNNNRTGIANNAVDSTFLATNPFVAIVNTDTVGGKSIYLDFLTLAATAAGTGGTAVLSQVLLDNTNRYTSGGTDLSSKIVNPNGNSANRSIAQVVAGDITAPAATANVRSITGLRYLKGAIPVIGDEYTIKFGGVDAPMGVQISTITKSQINAPKLIIPPGSTALVNVWLLSQSAASSFEPNLGWIEK